TTTSLSYTHDCPARSATCYFRVRSVTNGRNPSSSGWVSADYRPWAPFNLSAMSGQASGQISVTFDGPTQTRTGQGTEKHYIVYRCDSNANDCSKSDSWATAATVTYPASQRQATVSCPSGNLCEFRMAFADQSYESML